jgi:predicted transposase YbfD/YdcC
MPCVRNACMLERAMTHCVPPEEDWSTTVTLKIGATLIFAEYSKTSTKDRLYIGSIPVQARKLAHAVRSHWEVENRLHWSLDVCLNDDQARARVKNSAQNLAAIRRMVLNILRLDKSRKGGIKTRRLVASTSDSYREQLLGLVAI